MPCADTERRVLRGILRWSGSAILAAAMGGSIGCGGSGSSAAEGAPPPGDADASDIFDALEEPAFDVNADAPEAAYDAPEAEAGCGPSTCPSGCCDAEGSCRPGFTDPECGSYGAACLDCAVKGQSCDPAVHACSESTPCWAATCLGCCDAKGQCQAGGGDESCGRGGGSCRDCKASSRECTAGACACTGKYCKGCCEPKTPAAESFCKVGTSLGACGTAGKACEVCSLNYDKNCASLPEGGGQCVNEPWVCGPDTCAGCCQDYNEPPWVFCSLGNKPNSCGIGGAACVTCEGAGKYCVPQIAGGGVCTALGSP